MSFPKNFPFGKNIWIWQLWDCVGKPSAEQVTHEDIQALIQKLKANDIQIALVKCGDGTNTWQSQFTADLVNAFHLAGLKIFSWSFVYGQDPLREAAIANWALDLGADGHIFDAESQYEHLANAGVVATQMLQAVRAHKPDALVGHSPEPIIDYHQNFPYVEFGKYCDFVMPQIYFGEWGQSPTQGINLVYEQWSKWQDHWSKNGFTDSIKPIIPVMQCFDWTSTVARIPDFVLSPESIAEFVKDVEGYKAVSFYEYAHILRTDCWNAIRDSKVLAPTSYDLGSTDNQNSSLPPVSTQPNATPVQSTPIQTVSEATESPASPQPAQNATIDPASNQATAVSQPGTPIQTIPMPTKGQVVIRHDPESPSGVKVTVLAHTPHAILVKNCLLAIFHGITNLVNFKKNKGGEQK